MIAKRSMDISDHKKKETECVAKMARLGHLIAVARFEVCELLPMLFHSAFNHRLYPIAVHGSLSVTKLRVSPFGCDFVLPKKDIGRGPWCKNVYPIPATPAEESEIVSPSSYLACSGSHSPMTGKE